MINYTKKWWLLGCHGRAEKLYSIRGSNDGNRVLISQTLFINGDGNENKGLIHKHNPFVRFRLSHLIFWKKEYTGEQLKIKRHTYNYIYEVCVQDKYITKDEKTGYPTVTNPKSYNIRGFPIGYLQGLGKNYDKVWFAIGAIIVALIGSSLITGLLIKKDEPLPTPIINNITTPDVNPTINVYPNIPANQ